MQDNELVFSTEETEILKKLGELVIKKKFTSAEEKKMFWQDVRILQYEYFAGSLPQEIAAAVGVFCGDG